MNLTAATLLAQALELPESDRADVATQLIESLDPITDGDAETAWSNEILNRIEDMRGGRIQSLSWPEARRLIMEERDNSTPT